MGAVLGSPCTFSAMLPLAIKKYTLIKSMLMPVSFSFRLLSTCMISCIISVGLTDTNAWSDMHIETSELSFP